MNKKLLLFVLLPLLLGGCGESNNPSNDNGGNNPSIDEPIDNPPKEDPKTDDPKEDPAQSEEEKKQEEAKQLATHKSAAVTKLDEIVNPVIEKITDADLKNAIQTYYNNEKKYIDDLTDLETAKNAASKVASDTVEFVKTTLKPIVLTKLNQTINPLIEQITYQDLKTAVQDFYNTASAELNTVQSLSDVPTIFDKIVKNTKDFITSEGARMLLTLKNLGIAKLDEIVNPVLSNIKDEQLKSAIQTFYNSESKYINDLENLEDAKNAPTKIATDAGEFTVKSLKPIVLSRLNATINPLIDKIEYQDLKISVQDYYNTASAELNTIQSLSDVPTVFDKIVDNTKQFIIDESEKILTALKNEALEELDPYVTALIGKIPFDTLKTDTQAFYTNEKAKLAAVSEFEDVAPCVKEIKEDLEEFVLTEAKKIALSQLDSLVTTGLGKIPNQTLKDDLTTFWATEKGKLNAISKIENVSPTLSTVISETEAHIKSLLASTVKYYISRLTAIETATAYDYLPAAMAPRYTANLVNASDIAYDFTNNTNVSSINQAGFGEQWQMVVENIEQSIALAKVFNVAQTALSSAGQAIDIYLENSYADEMSYSFSGTNYTGLFEYKDGTLIFNLSLTSTVDVPVVGSVKPVIKMEYDLLHDAKGMFISLGDAYKIKYVISDNSYEMVTTYGLTLLGKTGSRSSCLSINKDISGKTSGHIYEFTTLEGSDKVSACADFYVQNGYVSVVGNKSSGMIGFDGYINELYLANEGRLIGYEVRETKTIVIATATYNTLWFNLADISGISSVKVTEKTSSNKSKNSTVDVYVNGSSSLLSPTYNNLSRKYDIELRKRYYYTYDSTEQKYVSNEVDVPMMRIQEGKHFDSFSADILKDNSITASVSLNQNYLDKILADYDSLIDIFISNKDNMSSEAIGTYLAQYE